MSWGVWCEVWGGVTGSRSAWQKGKDGSPEAFATRELAEEAAKERRRNLSPFRTAEFRFTAKEMP